MPEPKIEVGPENARADADPWIERLCDVRFLVDIDESSVVLDMFSLGGRIAGPVSAVGASVVCLAADPGQAKEAAAVFGTQGSTGVRVVCGSRESLPFRDAAFDCAFDVIADPEDGVESGSAPELKRVLKETGSLVWGILSQGKFGAPPGAAGLRRLLEFFDKGKGAVASYAVIPSARDPRAYLPSHGVNPPSTYTRFFAERFFSAETPKSKLLRGLAMRPTLGRLLLRFVPSRLLVACAKQGGGSGVERLLMEATRSRDLDIFALSGVWRGRDVPSSAAFMGFEKGCAEPTAIAKISRNPAHNRTLDDEFDSVWNIRPKIGPDAADSIPRPLSRGHVQKSRVAVYEWAGGKTVAHILKTAEPTQRMAIFEQVFGRAAGFLVEICRHTAKKDSEPTLPLGNRDAAAAAVVELAAGEDRLELPAGVVARLREIAGEGIGAASCLGHGDFAPCNVQLEGRKIWVLDWELAAEGRTPMFDLASFLAHSFEEISPSDNGLRLLAEAFSGERQVLSIGVHETISSALSAFGVDRKAWKRFFAVYCAGEMLRDLLYFRLGTAPTWRAALSVAL